MSSPSTRRRFTPLLACFVSATILPAAHAQQAERPASDVLQHALHLADLYNWSDAAPEFREAEKMFQAAGDQRNALYAKLGRIRSNIQERTLPETSGELTRELDTNPILQTDKQLRLFCLIIKGDIDGEIDARAMAQDWEQVQTLAGELGDEKWQYRASAQLGLAAFYNGDLTTARKNVGGALMAATQSHDVGAQIRFLTAIGVGLAESKMYDQAVQYLQNALKIASATPDVGYPFTTNEALLQTLIGSGRVDAAQHVADDILLHAQERHLTQQQAIVLNVAARIASSRKDNKRAIADLDQSITLSEAGGFVRELAEAQSLLANIYREHGEFAKAEQFATEAAASTQASGDMWWLPERLQTLADLQVSQGKYEEADRVYDRAGAFIDSMIGNFSSVLEKTAVINASSELYSRHFSLIADRFNDPAKAYSIVEQVRGRVATDLLMAGSVTSDEATKAERSISQLRLKLRDARSTSDVHRVRDQIFMAEQSRWINPEINILKAQAQSTIGIDRVQHSLDVSAVVLEYVVADPKSYCLVISRTDSHIVRLPGKQQIEALVAAYLKAVKAKQDAYAEARNLYDALLRPIREAAKKATLVVVRDGQLHFVPFDGFIDVGGHYVAEAHTVIYAPSASSFYLLTTQKHDGRHLPHTLLAIGGIPYGRTELQQASITRGYDANSLFDLPGSREEVLAAEAAVHDPSNMVLVGSNATESAFKRADLPQYRIIHLAVHGLASTTHPDRSALILLSDPSAGEDGFLQASEIVQLRFNADLVILSACDTAVGPVQGEEGIATLSRAFLLAGARAVVSTLWAIDDTFSLFLMKQFYKHLAAHEPAAYALAAAKRDMLRKFGREAVPYYWAGLTFEGAPNGTPSSHESNTDHHAGKTAR